MDSQLSELETEPGLNADVLPKVLPNRMRRGSHSPGEIEWAKEMIGLHGMGVKSIRENNMIEEYNHKFGKTIAPSGMYAWFRYVTDPDYKKRQCKSPKGKEKKEQMVFTKSSYIAYINGVVNGYESKEDLIHMMESNKILSHEIKVFKAIPIEVQYAVKLGE